MRIAKIEHDIHGNGSIGMKEQLAEFRKDMDRVKKDIHHIHRVIWLANGALAAAMFSMKFLT